MKIPVEVSARHAHLSKKDLEKLFGESYELKVRKQLTQPSDFACQETISIAIANKEDSCILENIRIVGPVRKETQVEISLTDAFKLGIVVPIRLSGDLAGSSPVKIIGPAGQVELEKGLIIAKRHIHCSEKEAKELGLKNSQIVSAGVEGERKTTFYNIVVRTGKNYKLCLHLDTDEGNAAGINKIGEGEILI
jgi:putative phosphotransacetylase